MKVIELMEKLTEFKPEQEIVFSRDEEGNGFMNEADIQDKYFGGDKSDIVVLLPFGFFNEED
jgi:hypothetical protein